jgi:hypothetical protein
LEYQHLKLMRFSHPTQTKKWFDELT